MTLFVRYPLPPEPDADEERHEALCREDHRRLRARWAREFPGFTVEQIMRGLTAPACEETKNG